MQEDLLCIKIKEGLYIGNRRPAEDVEFLLTNKFGYVVNCTMELANHFDDLQNIKYLKLKYEKNKPQKLWGETYKKLHKFCKFIEEAEENAECCLVHSNLGNNRCCAVIIAYLMKKFLWTFDKTINYIKSKKVEMKLSQSYIMQLRQLEQLLQQENSLSNDWRKPYLSDEQRVIANTYINTSEIKYDQPIAKVQPSNKRVIWKDRLDKMLAANNKIKEQAKQGKSKPTKALETGDVIMPRKGSTKKKSDILAKNVNAVDKPLKKTVHKEKQKQVVSKSKEQDSIVKLIKKKLKQSRQRVVFDEAQQVSSERDRTDQQSKPITPVYNLTVNNFINPNINIFTKEQLKQKIQDKVIIRPASGDRRAKRELQIEELDGKISRTFSQKQHRSLQRDRHKATNISATLMKSLISLQNDIRRQETSKADLSTKVSQYKSANIQEERQRDQAILTRLESPKQLYQKKMQKSMSFESKKN